MKTPTDWAKETAAPDGKPNFVPCRHKWQRDRFSWQHAAAAVRHGWNDHRMATSSEIELTREDYLAALKAVADPKAKRGPQMHVPAVSVWCTHTDKVAEKAGVAKRNTAYRETLSAALDAHAKKHEAWHKAFESGETDEDEPAFRPPEPPPVNGPTTEVTP
jgi:hypothetical protein